MVSSSKAALSLEKGCVPPSGSSAIVELSTRAGAKPGCLGVIHRPSLRACAQVTTRAGPKRKPTASSYTMTCLYLCLSTSFYTQVPERPSQTISRLKRCYYQFTGIRASNLSASSCTLTSLSLSSLLKPCAAKLSAAAGKFSCNAAFTSGAVASGPRAGADTRPRVGSI